MRAFKVEHPLLLSSAKGKRHPLALMESYRQIGFWIIRMLNTMPICHESICSGSCITVLRALGCYKYRQEREAPALTPFISDSEAFNFKSLHFEGNLLVCSVGLFLSVYMQ
jgi:hypothetical protein